MTRSIKYLIALIAVPLLFALFAVVSVNKIRSAAVGDLKDGRGGEAVRKLELVAGLGDRSASRLLGLTYAFGWSGVERDRTKAAAWFEKAQSGCRRSMSVSERCGGEALGVAQAYERGDQGVDVGLREAAAWRLSAARQAGDGR